METAIVLLIVFLCLAGIIYKIVKSFKSKCCGCGCSGCNGHISIFKKK